MRLLLALLLAAPALAQDLALRDVHVVDVEAGVVVPGQTVVVADGRIVAVGPDAPVPDGVEVVDGRGRYLMPGLWDMHAHLRHPIAPAVILPQLVASGITGVREMASACEDASEPVCLDRLLAWRDQIEAGALVGPRLVELSSFPLNPPWDYAATEDEVRGVVRELHGRGVDLIKTYYRLSPEALGWVADEAEALGIYAAGHLPLAMTTAEAAEAGVRSVEHTRDLLFDCFPGSAAFRAEARSQNPPPDVLRAMVEAHDPAVCDATFATMVAHGTAYVPTHVTRRMDAFADDPTFRDDPRRRHLPAPLWESWQADADAMVALDPSPGGREAVRAFHRLGLDLTRRAHEAGVVVLLGTDGGDTYSFFGTSAHDELGLLVEAGLTPAEALAAATIRPAEFVGLGDAFGSVAVGKHADLVLLRADPLADIRHVRQIEAVVIGGRLHDRAALDALWADVEAAVAAFDAQGGGR